MYEGEKETAKKRPPDCRSDRRRREEPHKRDKLLSVAMYLRLCAMVPLVMELQWKVDRHDHLQYLIPLEQVTGATLFVSLCLHFLYLLQAREMRSSAY